MTLDLRDSLATEAGRIEEDCLYSARGHFEAAASWRRVHYGIGIPATVLAAVAGGSAVAEYHRCPGLHCLDPESRKREFKERFKQWFRS